MYTTDTRTTALGFLNGLNTVSPKTVTRFCPSLTGRLHLGHAFNYWLNWLEAKKRGGVCITQIELRDWALDLPGYTDSPSWYRDGVKEVYPEVDRLTQFRNFVFEDLRLLPAFNLPYIVLGTGGITSMLLNSWLLWKDRGYQSSLRGSWFANPARTKAMMQAGLGVDLLIRGRDLEGETALTEGDLLLEQFLGRPVETRYHPILVRNGIKVGSSSGADSDLYLNRLLTPDASTRWIGRSAGEAFPLSVLTPLFYLLAWYHGTLPSWNTFQEMTDSLELETVCSMPNIEWNSALFSQCRDLIRASSPSASPSMKGDI